MIWNYFKHLHFLWHLVIAGLIRAVLIAYGIYHDENFTVPYTDVDYKVFTDAARHVANGGSPYDRHTYRYSPLIAIMLVPNITLHPLFGKIMFSIFDLAVGLLIRSIVKSTLKEYDCYKQKLEVKSGNDENVQKLESGGQLTKPNFKYVRNRKKGKNYEKRMNKIKSEHDIQADISMMIWLYNPLTIGISTRGNSDSIAGLLVLFTVYLIVCKRRYFIGGLIHGLSVHIRLYPIIYSLAFFMYLSKYSYYTTNRYKQQETRNTNKKKLKSMQNQIAQSFDKNLALPNEEERRTIFKKQYLLYLIPNFDQIRLISGCLMTLIPLTYLFYHLYGYKFLFETYIYHVIRKDTRHNFSVFFYLQYLTAGVKNIGLWQKVLIVLPQMVLLLIFSIRYGLNKFALNFSLLMLTVTMVIYNTVLTSQYFVWILVVLPLCIWQIKMTLKTTVFLVVIWAAAQAAWLMPAYFLEFQGQNTFLFIWMQSVSFFCANIAILGRLIMNFMPVRKLKSA